MEFYLLFIHQNPINGFQYDYLISWNQLKLFNNFGDAKKWGYTLNIYISNFKFVIYLDILKQLGEAINPD